MKIERTCLADKVREIILSYIAEGKFQAGERLVELNVAKELGVSQAPVREAFQQLVTMKVLESQPHKGTRVREVTQQEMIESTVVRGILEQAAAEMAALQLKASIEKLETENNAIKAYLDANDPAGFSAHSVQFHRLIVEACGNQVLIEAWNALNFEAKFRICSARAEKSVLEGIIDVHSKVIQAFKKGDGKEAGLLLRDQANCYAKRREEELATSITQSSRVLAVN